MSAHHWIEAAGAAFVAVAWFAAEVGISAALRALRSSSAQDSDENEKDESDVSNS